MSEQEKRQDVQEIKVSSFAEVVKSRRTPVGNVLLKPLSLATGTLFKLNGGSTEQIPDPDNQGQTIDRAAYRVSTLNSRLLPINTELLIKIKGQKCIFNENDNLKLALNNRLTIVAFDGIRRWSMNGNEGLTASGIRLLKLNQQQLLAIIKQGGNR